MPIYHGHGETLSGAQANISADFAAAHATYENLHAELAQSVYMSDEHIRQVIGTLATGGHLLEEGVYGIGKTAIAKALAAMIGGSTERIQGDADKMPSDITGSPIWRPDTQDYDFIEGPIFANVVLVDEGHRLPERTQSGLIQGMEEGQVTVLRETYDLPRPQLIIATINFDGQELTKVLLDRFTGALHLPKQTAAIRQKVMDVKKAGHVTQEVASPEDILNMERVIDEEVVLQPDLEHEANTLIDRVYENRSVDHEESIEGTFRHFLNIVRMAKFAALASGTQGSKLVKPHHIAFAAPFVLNHRVVPTYEAQTKGVTSDTIVRRAIAEHLSIPAAE
jgi:MoxR-like ATPase